MSKTFDFDADNTSDHQPIILKLDYIKQLSNDQPVIYLFYLFKILKTNYNVALHM